MPLNSASLMELPWLNRLGFWHDWVKKERIGSAERIADTAVLAKDVFI